MLKGCELYVNGAPCPMCMSAIYWARIDKVYFGTRLEDAVGRAAGAKLVLDCSGIAYMSSRGLRALTLAKRKADGAGVKIVLAAPNEIIREILAISRYDKPFGVPDSVDAALAA